MIPAANPEELSLKFADTAHLLVSVATVLLRCTVESAALEVKRDCARTLLRLSKTLQNSGWDLADFCLERCKQPIERIASATGIVSSASATEEQVSGQEAAPMDLLEDTNTLEIANPPDDAAMELPSSTGNFTFPVDSLEYPWDTFWEGLEGPLGSVI